MKSPFIAPADGKCAPKLKKCDPDYIFYTDDGSCNNLQFSNFGQAWYPFDRILPASFADGKWYWYFWYLNEVSKFNTFEEIKQTAMISKKKKIYFIGW